VVVEQCLQIENVTKIQEFAEIFEENVTTDLTLGNLVWLAEQAIFGGLSMDSVNFITMPGDYNASAWCRTYQTYLSYVLPDADELLAIINESFNPYTEDLTTEGLDIMSVNADGTLSSTTGVVEDTQASG
ncbi:MAG: transcriptional regulator, partial [Oscillospiraceae bacterium]|nr:transcriptional regulator [Oscillospiraceae bacterium]